MRKSDAGRLGGLVTSFRHNHQFYVDIGRSGGLVGGRPRSFTLAEIRQSQPQEIKKEEVDVLRVNSHKEIVRLWKQLKMGEAV